MPSLPDFDSAKSAKRFQVALAAFAERLKDDRNILAAVLVGSLQEDIMWRKDSISL